MHHMAIGDYLHLNLWQDGDEMCSRKAGDQIIHCTTISFAAAAPASMLSFALRGIWKEKGEDLLLLF